jgi:hypothetical protein
VLRSYWGCSEVSKISEDYKWEHAKFEEFVDNLKTTYRFKGLWHFTNFSNLPSILSSGELYSRTDAVKFGKLKHSCADLELLRRTPIEVLSLVRFYYSDQTPTLYSTEGILNKTPKDSCHLPRPVYFLFSEELIWLNNTIFTSGNAASSQSNFGNSFSFFENINWKLVFYRGPIRWDKEYVTRIRQAELQSIHPVSLQFLKKIIFRSDADYRQAMEHWGDHELCHLFEVSNSCFSEKDDIRYADPNYHNYVTNYLISEESGAYFLGVKLKRPLEGYSALVKVNIDGEERDLESLKQHTFIAAMLPNDLSDSDSIRFYLNGFLCVETQLKFWK